MKPLIGRSRLIRKADSNSIDTDKRKHQLKRVTRCTLGPSFEVWKSPLSVLLSISSKNIMPKHERSRSIACVSCFKSCPDDCQFKSFFPNNSEIDYTKFFKVVKNASSLTALLNETVNWKVKIDLES
ncbi:hypothetical protein WN944_000408 [Citrus x changshan-huyou]|uniref:Uncharacterized protein n=1 Tax=Citrus x changshan-huyou TaxID=2935761 RepID=A0AAP0MFA2_9ROSI